MKKTILVYGLISGVIVSTLMVINMSYLSHCNGNMDFATSMITGYASMLIAFSLVFVGIRSYRDRFNGGVISFGRAFGTGILIVLIASTMYVATWLVYNFFFFPDFAEQYAATELRALQAAGAPPSAIAAHEKEMEDLAGMLSNPLVNAAMTYLEILPVGLLVSLISALILKRKPAKA